MENAQIYLLLLSEKGCSKKYVSDLFDPFASPVYMERDAKEKDIDQTGQ